MAASSAPHILLVEDDLDTASLIRRTLEDHFHADRVTHVDRVADAVALDMDRFDLVLSDLNLPDGSGLDVIERMLAKRGDLPIIIVTSESDLDSATRAIRRGAYDYVVKAGDYLFTIPLIVEKNLAVWQTKVQNLRLQHELRQTMEALRVKNQQLEDAVRQLGEQASTDPLTGLANRRHVQAMLDHTFAESQRYGTDLACLMIDLDHFKELNDSRGHQEGDRLLQSVARVLRANSRASDIAGRFGGDEFVVLMPQTPPDRAAAVAKRIADQFAGIVSVLAAGATAQGEAAAVAECSLSIGVACMSVSRPTSADALVARADAALYRAKASGKACIVVDEAEVAGRGERPALGGGRAKRG